VFITAAIPLYSLLVSPCLTYQFTDGQPKVHGFKSLGLRKVEELVGYGLPGEKAPNLANKISTHLEVRQCY